MATGASVHVSPATRLTATTGVTRCLLVSGDLASVEPSAEILRQAPGQERFRKQLNAPAARRAWFAFAGRAPTQPRVGVLKDGVRPVRACG